MDFGNLISRAFEIVKKNKFLWILGIVLSAVSVGGANLANDINYSSLSQDLPPEVGETVSTVFKNILHFLASIPLYLWIIAILVLLILIILSFMLRLVIKSWVEGALIGAVCDLDEGKESSLAASSRQGRRSFKALLWLNFVPGLIFFGVIFLSGAILVPLVLFVLPTSAKILALILLIIPLTLVILIASLALNLTLILAQRKAVIEGLTPRKALFESFALVKKHFLEQIALGLINVGIGCGVGCLTVLVVIPFIPVVLLIYILFKVSPLIGVPFGVLVFILLMVAISLIQSIFMAYKSAVWTLFAREIGIKKTLQPDKPVQTGQNMQKYTQLTVKCKNGVE